ncbi:hypothetical protein Vadar_022074 [Vaccinium darrowii]|uniref:Uncharacterized protein n=1 Tax=Vaccinium darrowii TaxID=229202 RepID=A0ACB7XTP1_9ERIC|nr:hypothetical protein Vadar_022074 [Vaccinium darrowii]
MDSEVVQRMRNFTLTADEEEDIVLGPEVHRRAMERCSFSLVGKVLTNKSVNSVALKDTLKKVWGVKNEVNIIDVENNMFLFRFSSEAQMQRVITEGPWSFDNQLVVMKKWEPGMRADNVQFHHADFWIQLWGLPFEYISGEIATIVGRRIGEVVDVDEKSIKEDRGKFVRVRVRICIDKPLKRGGNLVDGEGNKVWISYKYERLPIFCYYCGMLGHEERYCQSKWEKGNGEVGADLYGPWLQASVGRGRRGGRRGESIDDSAPGNGRSSEEGDSEMWRETGASKELESSRWKLVGVQSACSGDPIPAGGGCLVEGVGDAVVTGCRREMFQAPNKGNLNLNGMEKAGMKLVSNLNVEFLESKDMGGSGPDLFAKGGPEGKALKSNLGDSDGGVQSQALEKASLGPLDFMEAQEKLGLSEAQLCEVSVQNLELEGLPSTGGDLVFKASPSHTSSKGRRGRGKGGVQAIHSREKKGRSSGGSTGGGLLGKRRSLTDCDVSEARYDDGVFKRFSLKEVDGGNRVEEASPEWPHRSP